MLEGGPLGEDAARDFREGDRGHGLVGRPRLVSHIDQKIDQIKKKNLGGGSPAERCRSTCKKICVDVTPPKNRRAPPKKKVSDLIDFLIRRPRGCLNVLLTTKDGPTKDLRG